jgi:adenine/guanine phosphoribosyltransferase-like PRPP-binding protein
MRVFRHQRLWQLTPDVFSRGAGMLASAAGQLHGPIDAVVGIAGGGLPLAALAAQTLNAPRYQVYARHNATAEVYLQATGQVVCATDHLAHQLGGRHLRATVLLVDDICGSSATLNAVTTALAPFVAPDATIITAVLCLNAGATSKPDLWLWDVADWVVFPWEAPPGPDTAVTPLPLPTAVRTP